MNWGSRLQSMSDQRVTAEQKRAVRNRARGCCEYCGSQDSYSPQPFVVEHILPRSKGGPTKLENLAWACQGCNSYKHIKIEGIDPANQVPAPLFHPRNQRWDDHFAWDAGTTRIIGLTPTGRATVATLQMNREPLVNLRRVLHAMGEHPPILSDEAPGNSR